MREFGQSISVNRILMKILSVFLLSENMLSRSFHRQNFIEKNEFAIPKVFL